jgi:hypothetical protein
VRLITGFVQQLLQAIVSVKWTKEKKMSESELDQSDILLDLEDAIGWMYKEYSGVTHGRIKRIRELLDQLERTIE